MERRLAKISSGKLEIQSKGILNFWIFVNYEDFGHQGIGGMRLCYYDKEKEKTVGSAYGCEMIRRLLLALEVDDFSEMKDKVVFVHGDGSGLQFEVKGIELAFKEKKDIVLFDEIRDEFITK